MKTPFFNQYIDVVEQTDALAPDCTNSTLLTLREVYFRTRSPEDQQVLDIINQEINFRILAKRL